MSYLIDGKTGKWELVMGLEVHAQIKSNSKLFSTASTYWGAKPNSQVELVDSGGFVWGGSQSFFCFWTIFCFYSFTRRLPFFLSAF